MRVQRGSLHPRAFKRYDPTASVTDDKAGLRGLFHCGTWPEPSIHSNGAGGSTVETSVFGDWQ